MARKLSDGVMMEIRSKVLIRASGKVLLLKTNLNLIISL